MNPKLNIAIDEKRNARPTGTVAVGEKVDVTIVGLPVDVMKDDDGIPLVRFRVVDELGNDLVRFPLEDGDRWSSSMTAEVDFNTDKMRELFRLVPFDGKLSLGVIVDSYEDSVEFARGRIQVRQWSAASSEDPTVLPDWREVLKRIEAGLASVDESVEKAKEHEDGANEAEQLALEHCVNASSKATAASTYAGDAREYSEAAAESASVAVKAANDATDAMEDAERIAESVDIGLSALRKSISDETSRAVAKEEELAEIISELDSVRIVAVDELPSTGTERTIYLVPNGKSGTNSRDEWIWVSGKWEIIGSTEVDLSQYATKEYVDQHAGGAVASVNGKTGAVVLTGEDIRLVSEEGSVATVADRVNEVDSIATNAMNALGGKLDNEDENWVLSLNEGLSVTLKPIEGIPIPGGGTGGIPEIQTSYGASFVVFDGGKNGSASFRRTGENEVFAYLSDLDGKLDKTEAENIIPKRVKNDDDTERIDGSGNVYALDVPKSMYFIVDRGWGGGTDLQEWTLYSSGNGVWKWSNNGVYSSNSYYITYDASAGTLSASYESGGYNRTITVSKNLDPTAEGIDFGGLGGLTVAQYSCSYVPKTNQRSEPSEPTDRLARESQLDSKLDKTGGMVASLSIGTEAKNLVADHLGLAIRSGSAWEREWAFPDQDGTFAMTKDIRVTATTATALKDRDCATVAYTSGMTITFAAATNGLRSFEVLITGCEAGGSINFPSVVYRGESDALTLEAGDNHLVFAEYKSGEFFVTRHVANTITIG